MRNACRAIWRQLKELLFSSYFPYLAPMRLERVLFLIQFLGRRPTLSPGERAVQKFMPLSPMEGTWTSLAGQHPEFFRVTAKGSITLWARLFEAKPSGGKSATGDEKDRQAVERRQLSQEEMNKLMEIALKIHEQQVKRHERRGWFISLWVGIATAIVSGIAAYFKFSP